MNLADCKKDSDAVHESVQRKTLKRHVGCFDASAYKVGHYICSRLHDVPVNLPDEAAYHTRDGIDDAVKPVKDNPLLDVESPRISLSAGN